MSMLGRARYTQSQSTGKGQVDSYGDTDGTLKWQAAALIRPGLCSRSEPRTFMDSEIIELVSICP
ncbi:hypothetical protein EYF80_021708 [Liparis tanakae]|uniref:Uncharacterized protein n=1 Tax=Liparis tanakae TaxID=230148 RepID=A0A4Z2HSW7_9TELE|nr:hypothetical protein EYF80_021708 [Liparis tanakae]